MQVISIFCLHKFVRMQDFYLHFVFDFRMIFQKGVFPDLLATSGDYLRVWRVGDTETRLECLLNNVSTVKP